MTSHEMRESKAYKTYLGYAIGATPPKKARKFKKHASPKLTTVPVSPEEPTRKSKRKGKITVEKRKGIDLSYKVALTVEAQYQEVRKKSLRDFYKTHPSGSGTITKLAPSAAKIKPSVTNEETGAKPRVPDVTEEESTKSEAESWGRDEDDSNNEHDSRSEGSDQERDSGDDKAQSDSEKGSDSEHETDENESGSESDQEENEEDVEDDEEEKDNELVKTPSNSTDDKEETNVEDKAESDDDKGMDYTINQFDNDENIRLNEPVDTDKGFIQKESTDAEMINTKVPVTSSSHSSDLASKFLKFLDIPHIDAEIVSPMDVHVHHERSRKDKDKDEDPSAGSDRGLKKRKTSKDAEPTTGPKAKESVKVWAIQSLPSLNQNPLESRPVRGTRV
ncbi:hypothetical protein Tco_0938858 [Tanacetum coccineum]|uniref:Uncharacterized protein n=1 Tax=Tanacetum coccineum TaxID=301880 RepID=A0ABQ5DJB3_9ASTR